MMDSQAPLNSTGNIWGAVFPALWNNVVCQGTEGPYPIHHSFKTGLAIGKIFSPTQLCYHLPSGKHRLGGGPPTPAANFQRENNLNGQKDDRQNSSKHMISTL